MPLVLSFLHLCFSNWTVLLEKWLPRESRAHPAIQFLLPWWWVGTWDRKRTGWVDKWGQSTTGRGITLLLLQTTTQWPKFRFDLTLGSHFGCFILIGLGTASAIDTLHFFGGIVEPWFTCGTEWISIYFDVWWYSEVLVNHGAKWSNFWSTLSWMVITIQMDYAYFLRFTVIKNRICASGVLKCLLGLVLTID